MLYAVLTGLAAPDKPDIPKAIISPDLQDRFPYLAQVLKGMEDSDLMSQGLASSLALVYSECLAGGEDMTVFLDRDRWQAKMIEIDTGLQDDESARALISEHATLVDLVRTIKGPFVDGAVLGWLMCSDIFIETEGSPSIAEPEGGIDAKVAMTTTGGPHDPRNISAFLAEAQDEAVGEKEYPDSLDDQDLMTAIGVGDVNEAGEDLVESRPVHEKQADEHQPTGGFPEVKSALRVLNSLPGVSHAQVRVMGEDRLCIFGYLDGPVGLDRIIAIKTAAQSISPDADVQLMAATGNIEFHAFLE